jgi:hypothetical protein
MKRFSVVLLLLLLAACGSEGAPDSGSDAPSGTPTPMGVPTVVGVYHATAAGGPASGPTYDLGTDVGVNTLLSSVRSRLKAEVSQAIAATVVPEGQRLLGGVVVVACAAPASATLVELADGGIGLAPVWVEKPPQECFAPVTSIALALVPEGWSPSEKSS